MKSPNQERFRRRLHLGSGFTLVELMISITLGLVLLAGVTAVFLSSKQSFRTQESLGQVQETGRFLNYLMYPYVRLAGYLPDPLLQVDPAVHFRGSWRQIFGTEDAFFDTSVVTGIGSVDPEADALMISYAGRTEPNPEIPGAVIGTVPLCLRTSSATISNRIQERQIAASIFYLSAADPATGLKSLNCAVAVIPPVPVGATLQTPAVGPVAIPSTQIQSLLSGVTAMVITYGVDTNPADDNSVVPGESGLVPDTYVRANGVVDWRRVVTVQIQVTAVGSEQTEGATGRVDDRRLARQFTTLVNIRNRLRT
jgi:type IV pilus assembly protein PilW